MTIKRAFLAALAVLMMPALAMAQTSTTTYPGTWDYQVTGPADLELDMTLTCNGGTPLTQTVATTAGNTINFTVVGAFEAGALCDITIEAPPAGWDIIYSGQNSCTDIAAVENGATDGCNAIVYPTAFEFSADVTWTSNTDMGSDLDAVGSLDLECTNVYVFGSLTTVSYADITVDASGNFPLPGTYAPDPAGNTNCTAELSVADSAVEVDNGTCATTGVDVEVGDGDVSCAVSASVFFEGIPTLSQYGMALMALLMLGVGFIGFRRFV